jgi:valyl-tRNA synthetase
MNNPTDTHKNAMDKNFDFKKAEGRIYSAWEKAGVFTADPTSKATPFVIVIPPPNVTGSLHMGHALNMTLQDVLTRYHRMKGDDALWLPGMDHAGIATQAVVERHLESLGLSRAEMGREKFLERVWLWKEEYGGKIMSQLKRLGSSCDWSRERFTMDAGLSKAVREVFVRLYEEGLIYKGDYVVNWCPHCLTAISDIEVEREDRNDKLYYILYPGEDDSFPGVVVATTRPETLFGDVAVAVHPDDPRHIKGEGRRVKLPLTNRTIPIIKDAYVDKEFGAGALKVTPAHDANDWKIGQRHNLPIIVCIDKKGYLTEEAGPYKGLERFEARERVARDLEEKGLLIKTEPLFHNLGVCYRCRTVIEPSLSSQWFVKTKELAKAASQSVKDKKTVFFPENWENEFFNWMDGIRDWCVSRQLWWGHRIPAFYCGSCGKTIVDSEDVVTCPDCGGEVKRDEDVLDTWFSSALWPFSTLGWPEETLELKKYYPTTVLVTGFDIIFFWVARMMMMGLKFMGEVPFRTVVLHPLVRDASGQKMSKSKKNVIDPLEILDESGADAFRFALASQAGAARDLKISKERVAGYGRFVTKLWNASRFALSHLLSEDLKAIFQNEGDPSPSHFPRLVPPGSLPDRWIRSRLAKLSESAAFELENFRFDRYADALYHFLWDEFCDWYLELLKPYLYGEDKSLRRAAAENLLLVLTETLAIAHPVMPFVTEELYSMLPFPKGEKPGEKPGERPGEKQGESRDASPPSPNSFLAKRPFPRPRKEDLDPAAEKDINFLMDITRSVRSLKSDFGIPLSAKVRPKIKTREEGLGPLAMSQAPLLLRLMGAESLEIALPSEEKPKDALRDIFDWGEVWVPISGEIDLGAERKRLTKDVEKLEKDVRSAKLKLENQDYLSKAPKDVVEETRERLLSMEIKLSSAQKALGFIVKLMEEGKSS